MNYVGLVHIVAICHAVTKAKQSGLLEKFIRRNIEEKRILLPRVKEKQNFPDKMLKLRPNKLCDKILRQKMIFSPVAQKLDLMQKLSRFS